MNEINTKSNTIFNNAVSEIKGSAPEVHGFSGSRTQRFLLTINTFIKNRVHRYGPGAWFGGHLLAAPNVCIRKRVGHS